MSNGPLSDFILTISDKYHFLYSMLTLLRIFDGIEYLHSNSLVHRDLKPSNILVDHDFIPHINDFETIRILQCENQFTFDFASILYASPEQENGNNINFSTDVFSFGLLIYFLFEKRDLLSDKRISKINIIIPKMKNATSSIQSISQLCVKYNPNERISLNYIRNMILLEINSFNILENYLTSQNIDEKSFYIINKYITEMIIIQIINNKYIDYCFNCISLFYEYNIIRIQNDYSTFMFKLGNLNYAGKEVKVDYMKSKYYLEFAASFNNSDALYLLGNIYFCGNGVQQNFINARQCYELSGQLNNSNALFQLGIIYSNGLGLEKDYIKALKYFELSGKLNNSKALYCIGDSYFFGRGVECNINLAIKYYELSSQLNNIQAACMLGHIYYYKKNDYLKAIKYYELAAEQNCPIALNKLGDLYKNGKGVNIDYLKSKYYFDLSAKQNNSDAFLNLGCLYLAGNGVAKNYEIAIKYFEKSSAFCNAKSFNNLGILYEYGIGVKKNYIQALKYYEQSKIYGDSNGIFNLGNLYLFGKGVIQNSMKALQYFELSAKLNNSNALFILGYSYFFGDGVVKDLSKALNYITKAAQLNHKISFFMLGYIYLTKHHKSLHEAIKHFDIYNKMQSNNSTIFENVILIDDYLVNDHYNSNYFYENLLQKLDPYYFYNLGYEYQYGDVISVNCEKSLYYYEIAAKLKYSDAYISLAEICLNNQGIIKDDVNLMENVFGTKLKNDYVAFYRQLYLSNKGKEYDIHKAMYYLELSAKQNNPLAFFYLGFIYIFKNSDIAIKNFEISANLNNPLAFLCLGDIYLWGNGCKKNYQKAKYYYELAAKQNIVLSNLNLGFIYLKGLGVKCDYSKAKKYFEIEAKISKVSVAFDNLGIIYLHGLGVPKDFQRAKYYFELSEEQNSAFGIYQLGHMYEYGIGVKINYLKAAELYKKSSELNFSQAYVELCIFYFSGLGVKQDYKKGFSCLKKAIKLDNSYAMAIMALIYYKRKKYKKSKQYFEHASQLNEPLALYYLGEIYSSGQYYDIDLPRAIECYKKSIQLENQIEIVEIGSGQKYISEIHNYYYAISYNNLGLIYLIEYQNIELANNNIKESAFSEYPFGQNNYGILLQFFFKNIPDAKYMYKRSSKHNFSLAEYNLAHLYEQNGKIEKSIEFYIKTVEHETEKMKFLLVTISDKRLKISKLFIICMTNLKLFLYFYSQEKNDKKFDKSKKYFTNAISRLIEKNKEKYQFIFKYNRNDEKPFLYLKYYILNYPLFNLSNQPNIKLEDYIKENLIQNNSIKYSENSEDNKEEEDNNNDVDIEDNKNIEDEKHVNNNDENDDSELNKSQTRKEKLNILEDHLFKKQYSIIENYKNYNSNTDQINVQKVINNEIIFDNPNSLFEFAIQNEALTNHLIDCVNEIIEVMSSILYTYPYPILFGRIYIKKKKKTSEKLMNNINESFYEGFGLI